MPRKMRIIRSIFWFAVFLAATFCWVVLFEHGISGFKEGIPLEWEKVKTILKPIEKKKDISDKFGQ